MDFLSLGKEPISADQPTGSDVRYEPEFEELQAEIDKLSNPTASDRTDWEKVNKLASEILVNKAKDLLVGSYLAVAQIHTDQVEGFAVGLRVYRDLLEQFWDNLHPAKKRMRGRVAAIEWWLEKSQGALGSLKPAPLSAERIEEFRQDVQQIDELLREYLEDAPLLVPIERFLDSIPVVAEKKSEPEARAESRPEKPQKEAPPPEPEEVTSEKDAQRVLRSALQKVRQVAAYLGEEHPANPQIYRWTRTAAWSMVEGLPPATDGQTKIPPPAAQVQTTLNDLRDKGDWDALLKSAQGQLSQFIFWLDLNRFVAEALAALGDRYQDAHDAVCQETSFFIHRLLGLADLSFSDGTPFADAETKQWLRSIGLGGGAAGTEAIPTGGGDGEGHMTEVIQKAQAMAKKKKLAEAVTCLQKELRRSFSKRERLLWRMGLCRILMNSKQPKLALSHVEAILQDIEMYSLEEWEPDLALRGLKTVWLGLKVHTDATAKDQSPGILNRIAKLDPAEALRLGK